MDIHSGERDFFISYRTADESWAEWIAWELEAAGYSVFLQKWDFRPGENWVHQMQQGASSCRRTIVVLTPAYFDSNFTQAEWYNAFARDPTGEAGLLLPVRVKPCNVTGLLGQIIYIDLVGLETEQARRECLLAGIERKRAKPLQPPPSPDIFPDQDGREIRAIAPLPPPRAEDRRDLLILLDRVEQFWVKGVLEQSVQHEALINLVKKTKTDAVQHPWEQVLEMPDAASKTLPADASITQVFEDVGRLLLILGEPGSGKTMTLLELARDLINRAWNDPVQPVPVVFHLGSWKEETKTLSAWLREELRTKYLIPERVGRSWLDGNRLLPLLDGLDEVQADRRVACIRAINAFLEEHGTQGVAVCSRLQEYTAAPVRLKMRGAICLQPLTLRQVDQYLAHFGPELGALRTALQKAQALQDLAQSPLMLGVMTLAYQGASVEALAGEANETLEARRGQIFETYIARMFARKGSAGSAYPQEQTKRWLSWMAQNMQRHGQTIFMIEQMQPTWLGNVSRIGIYTLLSRISLLSVLYAMFYLIHIFGSLAVTTEVPWRSSVQFLESPESFLVSSIWMLVAILASCSIDFLRYLGNSNSSDRFSSIDNELFVFLSHMLVWIIISTSVAFLFTGGIYPISGTVLGLAFGLIYCRRNLRHDIRINDRLKWVWTRPIIATVAIIVLLIHGVWVQICILLYIFLYFAILIKFFGWEEQDAMNVIEPMIDQVSFVLIAIFLATIILWPFLFFLMGMRPTVGRTEQVKNYRIKTAIENAIISVTAMYSSYIIITIIFILFTRESVFHSKDIYWLSAWIVVSGMPYACLVAFAFGGVDVINYYILRFVTFHNDYTPRKLNHFLSHCVKLEFLRKVGGGYIFIHRLLLERFAAMWEREEKEQGGKVAPAETGSAVMAPA